MHKVRLHHPARGARSRHPIQTWSKKCKSFMIKPALSMLGCVQLSLYSLLAKDSKLRGVYYDLLASTFNLFVTSMLIDELIEEGGRELGVVTS
jgi:hypothetical protein